MGSFNRKLEDISGLLTTLVQSSHSQGRDPGDGGTYESRGDLHWLKDQAGPLMIVMDKLVSVPSTMRGHMLEHISRTGPGTHRRSAYQTKTIRSNRQYEWNRCGS